MGLDFNIDDITNTVQQIDVVANPVDESDVYENAFHARATNLTAEQQALANLNLDTSRVWKVVNPSGDECNGAPVGYKFFPGDNAMSYASPNAW